MLHQIQHMESPASITALHPRLQLHHEMLNGWVAREISAGNQSKFAHAEVGHVVRFGEFADGRLAWEWTPEDVDRWGAWLSESLMPSTIRAYQGSLRRFLDYISDRNYAWGDRCEAMGEPRPRQLCTPENTRPHAWAYEGDPARRAFTPEELATFFAALRNFDRGFPYRSRCPRMDPAAYRWGVVALGQG